MKNLIFLIACLCLINFGANAQTPPDSYRDSKVDSLARTLKKSDFKTPEDAAKALTQTLTTDREKARALFTWLTANVRYDLDGMDRDGYRGTSTEVAEQKRHSLLAAYRKGKGICEDYSRLFEVMASAVGLEVAFIPGKSAEYRGGGGKHAWNAVKLDGRWALLDATWGAGTVDGEDGRYHAQFQPGFFDTDPHLFVLNHLPDDPKWQLLETPVEKRAFGRSPSWLFFGPMDIRAAEPLGEALVRGADGSVELRLKPGLPLPPFILVELAGKTLVPQVSEKDGWTVLRFETKYRGNAKIWVGQNRRRTSLLAVYEVK